MKRLWWIIGAIIVLTLWIGSCVADTSGTTNGYSWTADDTSATVTGYSGTAVTLSVPSTLGGKPVTTIGAEAFADNQIWPLVVVLH